MKSNYSKTLLLTINLSTEHVFTSITYTK